MALSVRLPYVVALALLAGCDLLSPGGDPLGTGDDDDAVGAGRFDALDASCDALTLGAAGDTSATAAQIEAVQRVNCYRQLAGLPEAPLHPLLDLAAQSHADYAAANDEFSHGEANSAHELYTGDTARDRIVAAGYPYDSAVETVSEVMARQASADPTRAVDKWMESVYHRVPLLVPGVVGLGAGSAGPFDVVDIVTPWEHEDGGPAVAYGRYPVPDQQDVAVAWDSDWEFPDPAPDAGLIGVPVTLTLLYGTLSGAGNPYSVVVDADQTTLRTTEGAVPFTLLDPSNDALLQRSISLVPTAPYEAGTTYTALFVFAVDGTPREQQWSFTTAP